ncbi:MAG: transcription antitermination factor NusB, partial [Alphaproteobacteria bacterium]
MAKSEQPILSKDSRGLALAILSRVLDRRRPLEEALTEPALAGGLNELDDRERRYALNLVRTSLRHLGQIDDLLAHFVDKPLPPRAGATPHILRIAAADLLFLKTEPYAAVNSAVQLAARDSKARHFRGLANAVLRRVASEGASMLSAQKVEEVLLPQWLADGWRRAYGEERAAEIIKAHLAEPPLDITLKPGLNAEEWAVRLEAQALPTGSVRRFRAGQVTALPGFEEGVWWVQDAAAALPARLFKNIRGQTIIDLCAAPGGKTAWLAASGAQVIAVDKDEARAERMAGNLGRLKLEAKIVIADARDYKPDAAADGVLLDAPCSSTGTIRRHPDLPWIKEPDDIRALMMLQAELLAAGFAMLKPGGTLVYSVCSLEPEEGEEAIERFLKSEPNAQRAPISADEIPGIA